MGRRKHLDGVREVYIIDADEKNSKCSVCSKNIPGAHLGNLRNHLATSHPDVLQQVEANVKLIVEEPPAKKQKITVEYDPIDVSESFLDLIVKEGRPFTTLDSPSLKRLVGPIFKALKIDMINSHNVGKAIDKRANQIKENIEALCASKIFSMKIDSATRHTRRVIIINIQFIVKDKIEIRTIAVKEINGKHSGKNIKAFILAVLEEYGFKLVQVYSTTQDNGHNFILAGKLLTYNDDEEDEETDGEEEDENDTEESEESEEDADDKDESEDFDDRNDVNDSSGAEDFTIEITDLNGTQVIRCAAHTLALAVEDVLKGMESRFKKFRNFVKYLRKPTIISDIKRSKHNVPKLDNKTRWNSKYNMLLSLKNLRAYCQLKGMMGLSSKDWAFCDMFLKVFEPVKIATLTLQKEQFSFGDFFKCWIKLCLSIKHLGETIPLASKLYKKMMAREAFLFENNRSIEAALYLDPRFNQIFTKIRPNYFKVERAQQHLLELYKHSKEVENIQRIDSTNGSTSENSSSAAENQILPLENQNSSSTREDGCKDQLLETFVNELYEANEDAVVNFEDDDLEVFKVIRNYTDKKPLETDIIQYWYNKRFACPILYKLACIVNAVPASQVSVERCFSTLRFILNDYRTRMGESTLEKLMLIMLNS